MADFWLEASIEFTCFLHLKGDSDAHFASLFSTSRVHKTWRLLGPLNRKQSSRLRFGVNWLRLLSWSNWELQVGWRTLSTLSMHICMYLYLTLSTHIITSSILITDPTVTALSDAWALCSLTSSGSEDEWMQGCISISIIFLDWFIIVWMFLRCARFYVLQSHRSSESRDFCYPRRTRLWCFKAKVVTVLAKVCKSHETPLRYQTYSNIIGITRHLLWH